MKTLMITKSSWKEIRGKCAVDPSYVFEAEQLVQECETVTTRNAAVGIISSLKAIDILDEQGKLTELGLKWANEKTYPEACRELAETYFPQSIRDELQSGEKSIAEIVGEYAAIEGMNEAGGRKNVRVLSMLMEDADSSNKEARETPSKTVGSETETKQKKGAQKRTPAAKKPKARTSSKGRSKATSSAKAQIEVTVPLEKLSDVTLALFSVVSPDEASVDVRFV